MMTYIGIILLVAGAVAAALMFFGVAPLLLLNLPLDFTGWVIVALVGAGLMYFNRRPGN
jgi:hypothetical protein